MTQASTKDCQGVLLELLIFLDNLCQELGIDYWIDGGTLLGAARNGSFIPWDDDLDMCLMYSDYIVLLTALEKIDDSHSEYILFDKYREPVYWSSYFGSIKILKHGIYPVEIDIIPMKSIEDTPSELSHDRDMANIARLYHVGSLKDTVSVKNQYLIPNVLTTRTKTNYFSVFKKHLKNNSSIDKNRLYSYSFNDMIVSKKRPYYTHDILFPLSTIKLEKHSFKAPANVKKYLKILYGDNFITPIPKDQQEPSSVEYYFQDKNTSKKQIETRIFIVFNMMSRITLLSTTKNTIVRVLYSIYMFFVMASKVLFNGNLQDKKKIIKFIVYKYNLKN